MTFRLIDITNKKKAKSTFPNSLICHGVKGSTPLEILQSQMGELRKSEVLILCSDHKTKLDSAERKRLEEVLEI